MKMDLQKIREQIETEDELDNVCRALCDEVQRNREVLTKLIAYLALELGEHNVRDLIGELQAE
jgi:hypothetical protein